MYGRVVHESDPVAALGERHGHQDVIRPIDALFPAIHVNSPAPRPPQLWGARGALIAENHEPLVIHLRRQLDLVSANLKEGDL